MSRCPLCPSKNNCVPPDGNPECDNHFIGEAPGGDENRKGRPFEGKTGQETNNGYLPLAGLRRDGVYVDNAISCLPDRPKGKLDIKRQADLDLLQSCAEHHLYPTLDKYRPKLIIPMGAFANRAINPNIDLELQHGIPTQTAWGTAFPMYHPAGGIHEPKKMLLIRTDWIRLRKYLIGKLPPRIDPYAGREQYQEVTSSAHLRSVLTGCNDYTMGCDTENYKSGTPFCLTFSIQPGTGYLIRAERPDILQTCQEFLDNWQAPILWHNWLWDGAVVKAMNLKFPRKWIRDTMVQVFHLGNLPQGLKALAYRELGMQMQDFDDLVVPYSRELVLDYYRNMVCEDWPKPDPEMNRDSKTGLWKLKKPHSLNTKLKTFFTYLSKDPDKDVFEAWDNWETCHEMVERVCGSYPGKCISHVPFNEALFYACRDADALLRLWPLLQWMRRRVRKVPQERWSEGYAA